MSAAACVALWLTGPLDAAASSTQQAFIASVTYSCPACGHLSQVVAADLTGKGKPDLVAIGGVSEVDVFHDAGNGTFTGPTPLAVAGATAGVAVGDFTGDGKLDIAVTIPGANEVQVFVGKGDGTFAQPIAAPVPAGCNSPGPIAAGDFNGDGKSDIAIGAACDLTGNGTAYCCGAVAVMLSAGNGTFTPAGGGSACVPNTGPLACYDDGHIYGSVSAITAADLVPNGKLDLVTTAPGCAGVWGGQTGVFLGNGDGSFTQHAYSTPCSPNEVAVGDITGDGHPDIVTFGAPSGGGCFFQDANCNELAPMFNDGAGAFNGPIYIATDQIGPKPPALADFNGDGKLDIAAPECCTNGDLMQVYLGNGDGTFASPVSFTDNSGDAPNYTIAADLNGDGSPDVAVAGNGGITVYLNAAGGSGGAGGGGGGGGGGSGGGGSGGGGSGGGGSGGGGSGGYCMPDNPPKVVVVMVMGLNSELPAPSPNPYDPLSVSACNASGSGESNASLHQLGLTFDTTGTGSGSGPTLMTSIAQTRALILPFSYRGAYMEHTANGPRFYVNAYSKSDPNEANIITEDYVLDSELQSIRATWPAAKLILIGHSEGGLVIKQWWRNWDGRHGGAPNHATRTWNVDGVYTLDGPINGGSNPLEYLEATQGSDTCPILTSMLPCAVLAEQFSSLWYDYALNGDDTAMARTDVGNRGIFTPIGTRGDLIMELLSVRAGFNNPFNSGQELGPQLLADFDSDGYINTLLEPGRLTPTVASSTELFDSHGVVYRDPSNISFLTTAVTQALTTAVTQALAGTAADLPRAVIPAGRASLTMPAAASARLAAPVVATAGSIVIRGASLGTAAGTVSLLGDRARTRPLEVVSWTPSAVTARAPGGNSQGVVILNTAGGQTLLAGTVAVTARRSRAQRLRVARVSGPAVAGRALTLQITALDRHGRPVPGAPIELSDGLMALSRRADRHGQARFRVAGFGSLTYVAVSGSTFAPVRVTWSRPPRIRFRLTHALRRTHHALRLMLTLHVTTAGGRPARRMSVKITLVQPDHALAPPAIRTTSATGTVALSVAARVGGSLTVIATTTDNASQAVFTLRGV